MSEVDTILSNARTKLSNAINTLGGKTTAASDKIISDYENGVTLNNNYRNTTIQLHNDALGVKTRAQNDLTIGRTYDCVRSSGKWWSFGIHTCDEYAWRNQPARVQALDAATYNESSALKKRQDAENSYNSFVQNNSAYNNAKQTRASILQQITDVNNAYNELNTAYRNAKTIEDNAYNAETIFMTNANSFQTDIGTPSSTYSAMVTKWDAYKIARTSFPSAPNSSNYDSFFTAYSNFRTSKAAYIASLTSNVLIDILNRVTSSIFSDASKNNAVQYGLTAQYADLLQSVTAIKSNVNNISIFLEKYVAYLAKKNNYDKLVERAIAKARAKQVWDDAKNTLTSKNSELSTAQSNLTTAQGAKTSAETAYTNLTKAVEEATSAKTNYDTSVLEKNTANDLLTKAAALLTATNNTAKTALESTFNADQTFMNNAGAFPNTAIGTNTEYNNMSVKWTDYNSKKTELNAIELTKIKEIADAIIALRNAYTIFNEAKLAYGTAVLAKLKSTDESTYITTNNTTIDDLKLNTQQYNVLKQAYDAIKNEWNNVTSSVNTSKVDDAISNYNNYITKKGNFKTALLLGQNQRDEAIFQSKLIGGRNAAIEWVTSPTPGCRNVQTVATTDQNMLENMACTENEYLSGYTTVKGFDAAPAGTNMTKDNTNIAQYLAVKYSCCTAPSTTKGIVGLTGLPGVAGTPGKVGPKGPDGSVGQKGPIGEVGDKGPDGPKGDKGEIGDVGEIGRTGPTGEPGTSIKVPTTKQIVGPPGPKGKVGPIGTQGPKGATGKVETPPPRPRTQLDTTVSLLNIQNKLKNYLRGEYNN